jgi:hypothetical protein
MSLDGNYIIRNKKKVGKSKSFKRNSPISIDKEQNLKNK